MATAEVRIRRSLADIQADYDRGDRIGLETLMRAWKGIKELPHTDANSFFTLGGFHGEPFRGEGATDPAWWGGYCQHGTVLFPTWHRAYLWHLEKALRSVPGCETVTLPFWDECSEDSLQGGIPRALTDEFFELDGERISNPLRSYVLPLAIVDEVKGDDNLYSKPAGYETVRYPLSGLVGTQDDRATTAAHNARFPDRRTNVDILNRNVSNWLNDDLDFGGKPQGRVHDKYVKCLDAPTYTLFSNTTSMNAWNDANPTKLVTALESPHNSIHLAVGGFDVPGQGNFSPIRGANGDMGENDTAGLDPIFYFHHCFIDYVFWTWQRRNHATANLTIDVGDPGASYVGNQPPAGSDPDVGLTTETALEPFQKEEGVPFTTQDVVDVEAQLGYSYGPGSLDAFATVKALDSFAVSTDARTLHVAGLDRTRIRGSFVIAAFAEVEGEQRLVGHEAVLSRWHVEGCANCQNHLRVTADIPVPHGLVDQGGLHVVVHGHDGVIATQPVSTAQGIEGAELASIVPSTSIGFSVELR